MLGEEPPADNPNCALIVFRKPTNGRLQRRFLKTDKIQQLFDYLDTLPVAEVGFETDEGNLSHQYEYDLVLPPAPQIKVLHDKEKTIEEEGLFPRALINIK